MARLVARGFFRALVAGDVETMLPMCASDVDLDGRVVRRGKGLRAALQALVARARARQLSLSWIRVLDHRQMLARFGPAPARIARVVRSGRRYALARFAHNAGAIAVLAKVGRFYRVVALTD
ncbi:MAG: hypothetical protein KC503_23220 [Myxococcales bacterium]|nr:hypothetical protein [Myxococcales bacterium]